MVYAKSEEEHVLHMRKKKLKLWLYAKLSKYRYPKHKLQYLVHVVGKEGIKVDPANIEIIIK